MPNYVRIRGWKKYKGPFMGNYSTVWIVQNRILPKNKMAMKVPHPFLNPDLIIDEARKQHDVNSLYVVRIYELRPAKKPRCILMEYCPDSLDKYLKRKLQQMRSQGIRHLPYDAELASILWGVIQAINDAHSCDVIHGDLKPGNILLDSGLTPKVSDFGAARSLRKNYSFVRGSTNWMAPEVLEGRDTTKESDYFSFGIIAYLLISGQHPFFCDDKSCLHSEEDNIRDRTFNIQPLEDLRSDIPPDIATQVMNLLFRGRGSEKKRTQAFLNLKVLLSKDALLEPPEMIERIAPEPELVSITPQPEELDQISQAYEDARKEFFVIWNPTRALRILDEFLKRLNWERFIGSGSVALADCWSLKAYINNSLGFYNDSIKDASNGLKVKSDHVNSLHSRGYAFIQRGEDKNAKDDLEKALKNTEDERKKAQITQLIEAVKRRLETRRE